MPLFVKNVRRLTMHGQEIASLLPRALGDGFYKPATVQARSGDEVMGGRPAQIRDDEGGAVPSEAGDAMDAAGVESLHPAHRWQDRREAASQPRCPRTRRTQEPEVMNTTPACAFALNRRPA
jgi:hypothetical protein